MPTLSNAPNIPSVSGSAVVGTGTGFSSLAYVSTGGSSPTGGTSNLMARDSNGNTSANNFAPGIAGNAAVGTITLTVSSAQIQTFSSGSGTATVILPDATTLVNGFTFYFNNNASEIITVETNGGATLTTMPPGSFLKLILESNGFSAGQWDYHWEMPSSTQYGTSGLITTGSIAATTSLTTGKNSGTGGSLLMNGSTSGTVTVLPQAAAGTYNFNLPTTAGTSGYFLTSAGGGSSAMTWTSAAGAGAVTTVDGDSGSAAPSAGTLTVSGGTTGLTTSASGSTVDLTGTLAIANGGTGVTSVTTTTTSGAFAGWTTAGNLNANSFVALQDAITTTGGTTNLGASAGYWIYLTGSSNQTVVLPANNALAIGHAYYFNNSSTGTITVTTSTPNTILVMAPSTYAVLQLNSLSAGAASWNVTYAPLSINQAVSTTSTPTFASLITAPGNSASSSLSLGAAYQNTTGSDVMLIVYIAVSAATSGSILCGVGSTNTPTQQTIVNSITLAALNIIPVTVYLPNNYYALISTSGTITATISGQQVTPI